MVAFLSFEVQNGVTTITCPDAACTKRAAIADSEIKVLVPNHILHMYQRFKLIRGNSNKYIQCYLCHNGWQKRN